MGAGGHACPSVHVKTSLKYCICFIHACVFECVCVRASVCVCVRGWGMTFPCMNLKVVAHTKCVSLGNRVNNVLVSPLRCLLSLCVGWAVALCRRVSGVYPPGTDTLAGFPCFARTSLVGGVVLDLM